MKSKWLPIIYLFLLNSTSFAAFAGPYDLIPLEIGRCEPSECPDLKFTLGNYKVRKLDHSSYVYTGEYNCSVIMGDDINVKIDVSVWGNGGWKPNFYHFDIGGVCSGFKKYFPGYLKQVQELSNKTCPIPPGVYKVENVSLRIDIPFLNSLPYGKYKNVLKGFDEAGNCILCVQYICNCIPKPKKKP